MLWKNIYKSYKKWILYFTGVFLDRISANKTKELIDKSLNPWLENIPISHELIFKTIEENNTLDVRDKC